jgi:hypothetical protein
VTFWEWSVLILCVLLGLPVLSYLCIKWGVAGFYAGKEANLRQTEKVCDIEDNKENEK